MIDILNWWFKFNWGEPALPCPYAWIGPFLFTWRSDYPEHRRFYWPHGLEVAFYPVPD